MKAMVCLRDRYILEDYLRINFGVTGFGAVVAGSDLGS